MEVILNVTYGGFMIPDDVYDRLGIDSRSELANDIKWCQKKARSDKKVVEAFKESIKYWKAKGEPLDDLAIAVIPDKSTDYIITEYDGLETLYYVLDGKIYYASVFEIEGGE